MWEVSSDPLKFVEAVDWLRARVPVTDEEFLALSEEARARAFTVGGVVQADIIHDVLNALDDAVDKGTLFEEFVQEVGAKLEQTWGDTVLNPSTRLRTIWQTNTQSAYNAGRWKQQTDPDVLPLRPYWLYDSVLDTRTSGLCRNLNGTLLPYDHEFWKTRYPPNHFGCRSGVRSLTKKQAEARGITEKPPLQDADAGFRKSPSNDQWEPDLEKYPAEMRGMLERKLKYKAENS